MTEQKEVTRPVRRRLSPEHRRRQLLTVAYEILDEAGPQGVKISEVAARAGVSRPLVYRFYDNRTELLVGVLEDFEDALSARFRGLITDHKISNDAYEVAAHFVHGCCDLIEERGGGVWDLLMSRSSDRDVVEFADAVLQRIIEPWYASLEEFCGHGPTPTNVIADMVIRAGDVALNHWVTGHISRQVAVDACVTSIAGILIAFANLQLQDDGPRTQLSGSGST